MKNRKAWELVAVLAVLVLGSLGWGLHRNYEFMLMKLDGPGTVCYGELRYKNYPFVTRYIELVFVSVLWNRRY